jgi:hypothetical protein
MYGMRDIIKMVLVCDGGIDHDVPICPPPNKVSIILILFFSAFVILLSQIHNSMINYHRRIKKAQHHIMASSQNTSTSICSITSILPSNGFFMAE